LCKKVSISLIQFALGCVSSINQVQLLPPIQQLDGVGFAGLGHIPHLRRKPMFERVRPFVCASGAAALCAFYALAAQSSSHMDAPMITLDDAANTTDVYAFVSESGGNKYLTTALGVYPFEEPGIGPNKHNFDDNVRYEIHVALGEDVARGKPTLSYQFEFQTKFKNRNTILQSYLGVIQQVDDPNQNLTQTYKVTKVDRRLHGAQRKTVLGEGLVPPNNQGIATPAYNTPDGEGLANTGVATEAELDSYTQSTIAELKDGHRVFAGQREDGFYGDIQAVFDLLQLRSPGKDSQGGFNIHQIVLQIPTPELGGDQQGVGVYATTSRRKLTLLRRNPQKDPKTQGPWIQVGRQGNPLFAEALVALKDKDFYNRSQPSVDDKAFRTYAENPELAKLLNALVFERTVAPESGRTDLAGIFIPDVIKVDLSTAAVPLAGEDRFNRLSVFGGDLIYSPLQDTMIPSGWPNGRRFGDDVVDIAVSAVASDLRVDPPAIVVAGDNVEGNDAVYNRVMPYAATPLNGRNHAHP
jgi:hypothetical protein